MKKEVMNMLISAAKGIILIAFKVILLSNAGGCLLK